MEVLHILFIFEVRRERDALLARIYFRGSGVGGWKTRRMVWVFKAVEGALVGAVSSYKV